MHLKLRTCVIRVLTEDDAPSIARYANNRKVWLTLRDIFPHPYRLEDAIGFIRMVAKQNPATTAAIVRGSEAIGCIGIRFGEDVHRKTAELGYWLAEPFWGQGIMSEAVPEFTRYAFQTFDLVRIFAEPFAENSASARVLEKAGFTCEGRLRANLLKDGKVLDSLLFAKVKGQ
jgi:ribosomal-protein-alanine N-acetyltransferase